METKRAVLLTLRGVYVLPLPSEPKIVSLKIVELPIVYRVPLVVSLPQRIFTTGAVF